MIVLFIVIANIVLQCVGARWCEPISPTLFHHMWEAGAVELMFEVPVLGTMLRIYRRKEDKIIKNEEDKTEW